MGGKSVTERQEIKEDIIEKLKNNYHNTVDDIILKIDPQLKGFVDFNKDPNGCIQRLNTVHKINVCSDVRKIGDKGICLENNKKTLENLNGELKSNETELNKIQGYLQNAQLAEKTNLQRVINIYMSLNAILKQNIQCINNITEYISKKNYS